MPTQEERIAALETTQELKQDMQEVKQDVAEVKARLTRIELQLETILSLLKPS